MTGLLLLRLFFPPVSMFLLDLMTNFMANPDASSGHVTVTVIENVALGIALLWVSGKVVSFLGQGVVAGAGTISGMLAAPGSTYSGAAATARIGAPVARGAHKGARIAGSTTGSASRLVY
jgi:hypothetical protein